MGSPGCGSEISDARGNTLLMMVLFAPSCWNEEAQPVLYIPLVKINGTSYFLDYYSLALSFSLIFAA
jgi:hypothetical protein